MFLLQTQCSNTPIATHGHHLTPLETEVSLRSRNIPVYRSSSRPRYQGNRDLRNITFEQFEIKCLNMSLFAHD